MKKLAPFLLLFAMTLNASVEKPSDCGSKDQKIKNLSAVLVYVDYERNSFATALEAVLPYLTKAQLEEAKSKMPNPSILKALEDD